VHGYEKSLFYGSPDNGFEQQCKIIK